MRKFYIIQHNPNFVTDAIQAINDGANAIEPDVTFSKAILCCLFFLFSFSVAFAQSKPDSTNSKVKGIIKFYPLHVLVGEVKLGYEKPIGKKMSVEFGAGYLFAYTGVIWNEYQFTWMHFINSPLGYDTRIGLDYKINHNTFITLLFLYKYYYGLVSNKHDDGITLTSFGVQGLFSKRFPISKNIGLEMFSGIGIRKITERDGYEKYTSGGIDKDYTHLFVYPSLQFGFSLTYKLYKK
ncbi:MAG: hypothetical protein RL708_559 [Bacteroidota bacterium]|jgi:hypothetical protein